MNSLVYKEKSREFTSEQGPGPHGVRVPGPFGGPKNDPFWVTFWTPKCLKTPPKMVQKGVPKVTQKWPILGHFLWPKNDPFLVKFWVTNIPWSSVKWPWFHGQKRWCKMGTKRGHFWPILGHFWDPFLTPKCLKMPSKWVQKGVQKVTQNGSFLGPPEGPGTLRH